MSNTIFLADKEFGKDYDKLTERYNNSERKYSGLNKQQKINNQREKEHKPNETNEWYTPYSVIYDELSSYPSNIWEGKDIICPCDFDIISEFPDVFGIRIEFTPEMDDRIQKTDAQNFLDELMSDTKALVKGTKMIHNKVERVTVSEYAKKLYPGIAGVGLDLKVKELESEYPEIVDEYEIVEGDERFLSKLRCNFLKVLLVIARRSGCKSITASGYDPFRSGFKGYDALSIDYSKYDIVVTNPPFDKYFLREFLKTMDDEHRHRNDFNYIVMTPFKNRTGALIAEKLQEGTAFLGYTRHEDVRFVTREDLTLDADLENSSVMKQTVAVDFLTSYSYPQDRVNNTWRQISNIPVEALISTYSFIDTLEMTDGSCPLFADSKTAPANYTGWIQCPFSFLDKLSTRAYDFIILNITGYWHTETGSNDVNNKYRYQKYFKHKIRSCTSSTGKGNNMNILIKVKPEYVAAHPEITWYSYEDVMKAREEE